MIYTHNNQWRSTILIDGTAEAKLADVLFIMENETFGQRKSASLVGGLGRLIKLSNVENREKTRNMKRMILNVLLLNVMALPCLLMFNENMECWFYNVIGICYSFFFAMEMKKAFKI